MDTHWGSEEIVEPGELLRRAAAGGRTSGLTLRGAVVRCWAHNGGLRIVLRDTDYMTIDTVEADAPRPAAWVSPGMQLEVPGALSMFEPQGKDPLSARRRWKGAAAPRLHGKADGLREREECADRVRAKLLLERRARLRGCNTLYLVTSEGSDGRGDIDGELAKLPAHSRLRRRRREVRGCNLYDAGSIAEALERLLPDVTGDDIVLATRGGGEWLDNFEDVRVIAALGALAVVCPTYVAVGHARNKQLLLAGIVHRRFNTPGTAVHDLDRMLEGLEPGRQRRVDLEVEEVSVGPHGEVGEPVWTWSSTEEDAGAEARAQGAETALPAHEPIPQSRPVEQARQARTHTSSSTAPLVAAAVLLAAVVLALGHHVSGVARTMATTRHALRTTDPRASDSGRADPRTKPEPARTRRGGEVRTAQDPDGKHAPSAITRGTMIVPAPAPVPAVAATMAAMDAARVSDPAPDPATTAALRNVAGLLGPFELGRDLEATRVRCAASHGMWLGSACRLPAGREYQFGLSGGLVQALTVRQVGPAPVPLLSGTELAQLQALSASGRGPWLLSAQPRQLTVQPRSHHPGL